MRELRMPEDDGGAWHRPSEPELEDNLAAFRGILIALALSGLLWTILGLIGWALIVWL